MQPGHGIRQAGAHTCDPGPEPEIASREGLDADDEEHDRHAADKDERSPIPDAGQRIVARRPREHRQARWPGERRHGRLVAVKNIPREQDHAGQPGRRRSTDERCRRERDGSCREPDQSKPQGIADGGSWADLVNRDASKGLARRPRDDGDDGHRRDHRSNMGSQLLDRDPAPGGRSGRDELKASAAGLHGERCREGKD